MLRRFSAAIVGSAALVVFLGIAGQAFAVVHPDCDGTPYNNRAAIHDFTITTPDSDLQGAASSVSGGALACGTDLLALSPDISSIYSRADVGTPDVKITDTAGVANTSYVGSGSIDVTTKFGPIVTNLNNQPAFLRVAPKSECLDPAFHKTPGGLVAAGNSLIACYKAVSPGLAQNWNAAHSTPGGKLTLTVGQIQALIGATVSLNRLTLNLCKNFGATGSGSGTCGPSSATVVQKNGTAPPDNCTGAIGHNVKGRYTVTATQLGNPFPGKVAGPATSCVPWKAYQAVQ